MKVEEVRANHVKVKWDKPEDNGGTEITGYVLEKMDLDTGRWIPAGEVNKINLLHRTLWQFVFIKLNEVFFLT